jgi:hypothetical protein
MNFARIAAAAVVAWVVAGIIGYLVNGILLADMFAQQPIYRAEADMNARLPVGFLFSLVGFFAFAYAYAKGYEGSNGVLEGLRFGVLIAVMINCFSIVWNYVTTPISVSMVAAFMVDYIVEWSIYGAIVGAIYKPLPTAARRPAAV